MAYFIQANNIRLHYLDHPGGEPLLVLLPGLTANAHSFDGLVQAGLSPRLRVLALDLRGRGLSDKPATGYAMADHAADVIALLDALDIHEVVLGGHSFGALLTIYIAAHHPERIGKIVLIDVASSTMTPRTAELIKPSLDRLGQVFPSWEVYRETIKQAPYLDGRWDPAIESYYRADVQINPDGSVQAHSRPETIAEVIERGLEENWERHVAGVKAPAILLNATGAYGPAGAPPVVPPEEAKATAAALANCRYVETPGNHMTMLFGQGAERMVAEIVGFVSAP